MPIPGGIVVTIALVAGAAALISLFFRIEVDPREPPVFYPKIPIVGHLIGMLKEGPLYLTRISKNSSAPMFTLPMLKSRMYICRSPALTVSVQRASSTLDFNALISEMAPRLFMLGKETAAILKHPTIARGHSLSDTGLGLVETPLSPKNLDILIAKQLETFNASLASIQDGQEVELLRFVTNEVLAASMITFWGPKHPYVDHPELVDAFWAWEDNIIQLTTGVLPSVFARKPYHAFQKLTAGFVEYIESGNNKFASELIKNRYKLHTEVGIPTVDCARLEIGLSFAFNANAGIIAFWALNNIFSRPELLAEIREEVEKNAMPEPGTISFASLKAACPLLNSVFRESMRFSAPMASTRWVTEDTLVADQFLVRKDTMLQIAGGIMHFDPEIWGPDVMTFNPRRFLYSPAGHKADINADTKHNIIKDKEKQVHAAAFRSFGGGSSLCPGRHFAQMEILCLAALFACGFEMEAPEGKEKVEWDPKKDDKKFPFAVLKPVKGINVKLKRRKGTENIKWNLTIR